MARCRGNAASSSLMITRVIPAGPVVLLCTGVDEAKISDVKGRENIG